MVDFFHGLIRISAFLRKEVVEIIRQPRLVLTLILGPFLILLLFGIGYRNQPRSVKTLFVADPNSNITQSIEQYATTLGEQLIYEGTIASEQDAIAALWRGDVDMVVVTPPDPEASIRDDQPATFKLYHNEIDPAQQAYIQSLGQIYIDEVNRRVISQLALQAQTESSDVKTDVQTARQSATAMREALEAGDVTTARDRQRELASSLGNASTNMGPKALLLDAIERETGTSQGAVGAAGLIAGLALMQESPTVSQEVNENQTSYQAQIDELRRTEEQLAEMEATIEDFDSISPDTMVRPFRSEVASIAPVDTTTDPINFYAPAVIALLLQHLAVTFGALSIVRERMSGTMELFRVSPIASGESLLGKYLSYLVFGLILGGLLFALLYLILRVPLLGTWWNLLIVVVSLLFTSLGLGFLISLVAQNESQAVQLSMITLLVAVFFSGMFMDLRYLWQPVQVVSWLTPATYGATMLQDVMLRGLGIELKFIVGLLMIGITFFMLSWILLQRHMKLG